MPELEASGSSFVSEAPASSGVQVPISEQSECWLKDRFSLAEDEVREREDGGPLLWSKLASLSLSECCVEGPLALRGHGVCSYIRCCCPRWCQVAARSCRWCKAEGGTTICSGEASPLAAAAS